MFNYIRILNTYSDSSVSYSRLIFIFFIFEVINTTKTDTGFSVELGWRGVSSGFYSDNHQYATFEVTFYSDEMLRFSVKQFFLHVLPIITCVNHTFINTDFSNWV